jgi:heme exporter protein A
MLTARGLTCVRGDRRLFAGLDLAVEPGQWLHVRGENGSGKTSLLRLLAGLSQPEGGQIFWRKLPVQQITDEFRSSLLFLGHLGAVKEDLSGLENLELASEIDSQPLKPGEALAALGRCGLKSRAHLPVRFLSAGQKRRVLLARLATRKASLWVLDEPFTALDTRAVDLLAGLITEHLAGGGMAVVTSHQPMPMAHGQVLDL